MTQNNLFMEADDMRLYIDVQPLFIDELENSKNAAAASAVLAAQSEEAARGWKNDIEDYKTGLELFYAQATDGLENSYNDSISGLNSAKNSAISNISSTSQVYINQAKYYAEQAQAIVDNRVSKDHLNQSKGLLTGAVSTDDDMLADVKYYAHSNYCGHQASDASPLDSKKFIKAGSPAITADGIASGFSASNYLTKNFSITATKSVVVKNKFNMSTVTNVSNIPHKLLSVPLVNANAISIYSGKFVTSPLIISPSVYTVTTNTNYEITEIYDIENFNYTFKLYNLDNNTLVVNESTALENTSYELSSLFLGVNNTASGQWLNGSLDLKQFSITVDGVEVFSGNKTGLDTVKSDDYTVVGTPTISADGIYKAASGSDYAYHSGLGLNSDDGFKLYARICPKSRDGNSFDLIYFGNYDGARLWVTSNYIVELYYHGYVELSYDASGLGDNEWVDIFAQIKKGKTKFRVSKTDGTVLCDRSSSASLALKQHNTIYFGRYDSANYNTTKIDLNTVRICDMNDNLVYQPCLKIPYTKSKTGCKVVDSIYRNRVTDMYEQLGYAPYYTLDEKNGEFTLPMGEVYGMIEKLRELIIQLTS